MEMKQHLERAFKIIAAMPVTGDNQDLVVAAKNELRGALDELQKSESKHGFDPKKKEAKDGRQGNQ